MELVQNLGDNYDVQELAVDGIGRIEVHKGRVRITLMRVSFKNGVQCEDAAISLVWSAAAFLEAHGAVGRARAMVSIGDLEQAGAVMSALTH
jgi:hypothetical protein